MEIYLNKEHFTLGFVFGYDVESMNKSQLEEFVSKNIKQVSQKTGKLVKINTFKWNKQDLKDLVSDETLLTLLPFVKDPEKELQKIEEQRKKENENNPLTKFTNDYLISQNVEG